MIKNTQLGLQQPFRNTHRHTLRKYNRDRISQLTHRFRPAPVENKPIRKRLYPSTLTNSEISNATIFPYQHILSTRNAMITSL